MARTVSQDVRRALYASSTSNCFLVLLDITSTELAQPLRVVNNTEPVTSNGNVYQSIGFTFVLPAETENTVESANLTLDNVDRAFTIAIRSVRRPLNVRAVVIESSDPDTIEIGPFDFQLRNVRYGPDTLSGQLLFNNYVERNASTVTFSNQYFPGLYN